MENKKEGICVICLGAYYNWGNNAEPVTEGRCCDDCNMQQVIPARLSMRVTDR